MNKYVEDLQNGFTGRSTVLVFRVAGFFSDAFAKAASRSVEGLIEAFAPFGCGCIDPYSLGERPLASLARPSRKLLADARLVSLDKAARGDRANTDWH